MPRPALSGTPTSSFGALSSSFSIRVLCYVLRAISIVVVVVCWIACNMPVVVLVVVIKVGTL